MTPTSACSSSGTGASIAVGMAPIGVGTETSGSILSPAQANSLAAVKPTVGLISRTGVIPISSTQDTAGPMERSVANAAMTLQSIAGHDPLSDSAYAAFFGPNIHAVLPPLPPGSRQ